MNKYISVFKTSLKQESKTLSNSLLVLISFAMIIYIFSQLWSFIYGNGDGGLINGYTLEMMIWYLIIAEAITYSSSPRKISRAVSSDIKSGKIAYVLNKPYSYFIYQIVNEFSKTLWKLIFVLIAGVFMGIMLAGPIINFSFWYILPMLLSILLAVFLNCFLYTLIGILSFWVEDSSPFTWIAQKFMMLFGLFFPVEFFPGWIQPFITYSPIFSVYTGPSKLVSNFSWELFGLVSLSQVMYILVFFALGALLYNSGAKKVNINGG